MSRKARMTGQYTPEMSDDGTKKRCTFCGKMKPLHDFAKNGVDAEGNVKYRDDCKTCYNVRRRENATKKKHTDFVNGMKRRGEENPSLSHQEWKECVIFFEGTCAYCGATMHRGQRLTRDHLVPVSKGGRTIQSNIVPACTSCNCAKGAKEWREWYMRQPFFSQDKMNKIFKWRTILHAAGEE